MENQFKAGDVFKIDLEKWETERLILTKSSVDDFDELAPMLLDYSITKYLYQPPIKVRSIEIGKSILQSLYDTYKILFTIRIKETNEAIGQIGFVNEYDAMSEFYWIGSKCQNKGYASEAAVKLNNYVFTKYPLNKMKIEFSHNNEGSYKIASKIRDHLLKEHPEYKSIEDGGKIDEYTVEEIKDGKVSLCCHYEGIMKSGGKYWGDCTHRLPVDHTPDELLTLNSKLSVHISSIKILKKEEEEI